MALLEEKKITIAEFAQQFGVTEQNVRDHINQINPGCLAKYGHGKPALLDEKDCTILLEHMKRSVSSPQNSRGDALANCAICQTETALTPALEDKMLLEQKARLDAQLAQRGLMANAPATDPALVKLLAEQTKLLAAQTKALEKLVNKKSYRQIQAERRAEEDAREAALYRYVPNMKMDPQRGGWN